MALWTFRTPNRVSEPLDDRHPLWRRVSNDVGVSLVKEADGTWREYQDLPQHLDAGADYVFGRTDRSSIPTGRGFGVSQDGRGTNLESPNDREQRSPLRIFRGGHTYIISDSLKTELEAVVTTEEPTGYDAYISAAAGDAVETGDEIMCSGRTCEREQDTH